MIRINIPGFSNGNGGPRWGDCTIIDDGKNWMVIDGYCGQGKDILLNRAKEILRLNPSAEFDLFLTHAHYDHYFGLRKMISSLPVRSFSLYDPDTLWPHNSEIKDEINTVKAIVREAQDKGITVTYLKDGDEIAMGEIKFEVYREQPQKFNGNTDAYINDGSLAFWFPELGYLTTGDAGLDCANRHGLHPVFIKIGHHGNDVSGYGLKPSEMAKWLCKNGCRYCWDNDYSTSLTTFLQTGREDCITSGMTYLSTHGDINMVAFNGSVVIYKGSKHWSYPCEYQGERTLNDSTPTAVDDVLAGKYGNGDTRITKLLDAHYSPTSVQDAVNKRLNGETTENPTEGSAVSNILNGIDISNHQGGMDLAKVIDKTDTSFVICKVTEGVAFVDKYCDKFMVTAQNKGKKTGFYHFARPEKNTARAEADFFIKQSKGFFNKGIPVLDWESSGKSNVAWALEWLERVESVTGVKPVIYMSESVVNAYKWKTVADKGYGLWVAKYRDYNVDRNYDMTNCGKKPVVKWWSSYMMWQWTSVGRLDGYDGNLDCDAFYGSEEAWDNYYKLAEVTPGGVEVDKIYAYASLLAELPVIRLGAKCNAVKLVQLVTGVPADHIDGVWGQETESYVKAWQNKYKLDADGLIDKPDWQTVLDWLATV